MLQAKIKLVDVEEITDRDDESFGDRHTDGVCVQVEDTSLVTIKDIVFESNSYNVLETTDGYFINSKWINYFLVDGTKVKPIKLIKRMSDKYIHIGVNTLYCKETNTLVDKREVSICSVCGKVAYKEDLCEECFTNKYYKINSYTYKPTPEFKGNQIAKDRDNPIWYGIELEYGLASKIKLATLVSEHKDEVYLKSDSSIRGSYRAELVTHPMSFTHLMDSNSFVNKLDTLDPDYEGESNGCHIHISRTAFKDNKHYSLFYFLFHSNNDFIQYIANRNFTNYCKPLPTGRVFSKTNTKGNKDRSVACNECNDKTIEVRIFQSSNKVSDVKSYIQFLDSLIKYTKYHKRTVSLEKWALYVEKYKDKYSELYTRIQDYRGTLNGSVTYREPTRKTVTLDNLKVLDMPNIVEIKSKGKTHKVDPEYFVPALASDYIGFYNKSHNYVEVKFFDIESITVEVV